MGGDSHHWYDLSRRILRAEYYLTVPSWCGSANIQRCVEIKHMYQCRIHPGHYYRRGGKCIECKAEWERRQRAEREKNRLKRLEKKAKDTAKTDFAIAGNGSRLGAFSKPGKRQTQVHKISMLPKPRKLPMKPRQEACGTKLSPEMKTASNRRSRARERKRQDSRSYSLQGQEEVDGLRENFTNRTMTGWSI